MRTPTLALLALLPLALLGCPGDGPNPCNDMPCENGGACLELAEGYACLCAAGFAGDDCETDVDDCAGDPCVHGTCVDGANSFTCTCPTGYSGPYCETNTDDCASSPCENGGTCIDEVDGYHCLCAPGFSGATCDADVDECLLGYCQNGSTCVDGVNSFTCTCAPGYEGALCAVNTDDCAATPCLNGGTCHDGVDDYTCSCTSDFSGSDCECENFLATEYDGTHSGAGLEGFFLGVEFTPTVDLVVDRLGIVDFMGNVPDYSTDPPGNIPVFGFTEAAPIALYDTNGQLAAATVAPDAERSGGFAWTDITPTTLTAGSTYAVLTIIKPPNAFPYINGSVTWDSRLGFARVLSTNSGSATTLPATYGSGNSWSNQYYLVDLGYAVCP